MSEMFGQKSIIDEWKKTQYVRKYFKIPKEKIEGKDKFEFICFILKKLLNLPVSKPIQIDQKIKYTYRASRTGSKATTVYTITVLDEKRFSVECTREAKEGLYTTELSWTEKSKVWSLMYKELVQLKEAPFMMRGQTDKLMFKHVYRKKYKAIKKEVQKWVE